MFGWLFNSRSKTPSSADTGSGRQEAERLLASGLHSENAGRLEEARGHYAAAVAAAPSYAAAHLNLGIALEGLGDAAAAARAFERALGIEPGNAYANYNLGRLLFARGELQRGEDLLRAAIAGKPDFPEAQVALANSLEARGDLANAASALEAALAVRPSYAGALRNYGLLLCRLERWKDAEQVLRRALGADGADADACYWLGNALVRLEKPDEAQRAYRDAVARRPDFAEAWCNLGNLLADRGSLEEAAPCLAKALALKPDYADAHVGLGNVLGASHRLEEAADCFRKGIALDPAFPQAHLNLGTVLWNLGDWRAALECHRAAMSLSPDAPEPRWSFAMSHVPVIREPGDDLDAMRRQFAAQIGELERWFDERRGPTGYLAVGMSQPFWLAYQDESNRDLLGQYGALCSRLMGQWQAQQAWRPAVRRARRPILVGIVSQFFRNHSVWHAIIKGWFQALDPDRVALAAFCLDPQEDGETRFAKARAARFEQGHAGLHRWAESIADAQPDVLVYPEIGMDPMALKLASMRLAPLQAASWGHPETTGLPTIDCFLSAAALEPPQAQANYTERLVALPNLGCHVQPDAVQALRPDLAGWGIDTDAPLLLCPGSPFKYAPEHDWVFAEIARQLGRCRLVYFNYRTRALSSKLRERLAATFAQRGLDFERCVSFIPWQEKDAFYGLLQRADVFLDTIGFSGFNTALQALQCGLPVVTLEGRFLRGRLASGMLRHIGLQELVVETPDQYIALAVKLARDPTHRAAVRRRIEERRAALFNDPAPIRALEDFFAQGA
jgi:predicted O-linked N-acetylglucosamine transferase (SPINDLY family)